MTRRTHLGVQQLEAREVPAIDLASALGASSTTGMSRAEGVADDAAGNSCLTGYFTGTVDFDPANTHPGDADILTDRGGGDIFVAKFAPND